MSTTSAQNPGTTAGKVPNASLFRARNHVVAVSSVPPLSAKEKLAVVNKFHQDKKKTPVSSIPPSQVALTPRQPIQGSSSLYMMEGFWAPSSGLLTLCGQSHSYIHFSFLGLASGTYLLDISVSGGDNWRCLPSIGGSFQQQLTLSPQSGHLLYPFVGSGQFFFLMYPPTNNMWYVWTKTELTKVA